MLAFGSRFSPFCIPVESGSQPESISEVNNVLNVALTCLHFTGGAKLWLEFFSFSIKSNNISSSPSLSIGVTPPRQRLHHLNHMIHRIAKQFFIFDPLFLILAIFSTIQVSKRFFCFIFVQFSVTLIHMFLTCSHSYASSLSPSPSLSCITFSLGGEMCCTFYCSSLQHDRWRLLKHIFIVLW